MATPNRGELPIIQATMDLMQRFVLLRNHLPRDHHLRLALGDRLVPGLDDVAGGPGGGPLQHRQAQRLASRNARLDPPRRQPAAG